jgi:GTP-binding protein Era
MDPPSQSSISQNNYRSGFVAIVGPPNVGKSTLINSILGHKIAITTPKPQTTRKLIRGILTGERFQIVFVDTPGIHHSKKMLNQMMVKIAMEAINDVDVVLFVIDASRRDRGHEFAILDMVKDCGKPIILIINKIDTIAKENILPIIEEANNIHHFETIIPVSAFYGDGIEIIIDEIMKHLEEGPAYYDTYTITDQGKEELISEIIREKIFLLAEQEIPYSTLIEINELKEDDEKISLHAIINVEKSSQKGILIGKDGRFITKVKRMAIHDLKNIYNKKIEMHIWVKVMRDWTSDERKLKEIGLWL